MTRYNEYAFRTGDIINTIILHKTGTSKLGEGEVIIGTWHFSVDQMKAVDLTLDHKVCLDCAYSYNSGDGKCYTHKFHQKNGLQSMMKRLNKLEIGEFNLDEFLRFVYLCKQSGHNIKMVRFGVYGEPIFLDPIIVRTLVEHFPHVGYTHQWHKKENEVFKPYFMASCNNPIEERIASDMGWRTYTTADEGEVLCPGSKPAGYKTSCSACLLCSGKEGKGKTNIFNPKH